MNLQITLDAMEAASRKALTHWNRNLLNRKPKAIPIEEIMEYGFGLTIDYRYITNNARVLGKTIFDDGVTPYYDMDKHEYNLMPVKAGTVIVDSTLLGDSAGRLRFTLAHEFGHWLIHKSLFEGSGTAPANMDEEQETKTERQANIMAGFLLMPKGLIKRAYFENQGNTKDIAETLASIFDVSKLAMKIRLKECGLGY